MIVVKGLVKKSVLVTCLGLVGVFYAATAAQKAPPAVTTKGCQQDLTNVQGCTYNSNDLSVVRINNEDHLSCNIATIVCSDGHNNPSTIHNYTNFHWIMHSGLANCDGTLGFNHC